MDNIKLTGNGETIRRVSQANGFAWKVRCSEESIQRLQEWSQDPVMKKMLGVLHCIPHILVPRDIPRKDAKSYFADPPDRAKGWFCAGELSDCQSLLEHNNITVNELWITAADLCQTLCRLYDLGIWGNAGRGSLLLRKPKNGELKYCLTGITDFHVYQYPQVFREAAFSGEDPVTSGLRLLVGGAALCADLSGGEEPPLEREIGGACTEYLGTFFRSPSYLPPDRFLETAEKKLRLAAEHLRKGQLKDLCLYLVMLGPDCRKIPVPALSSLTRSFYRCARKLDPAHHTKISAACIYPWDTVCIRKSDEGYVYGLSALYQDQGREKHVLLGGLLDCLNQELEQAMKQGTGALVCYIVLPTAGSDPVLTGMDIALMQALEQKHQTELCEAFICSADLQQKIPHGYSRLKLEGKEINVNTADGQMAAVVKRLLFKQRFLMDFDDAFS